MLLRRRRRRSWRLLRYERAARASRVGEATFVASHLEVVRLDSAVRPVLDFEVPKDVLLSGAFDDVVDGGKDAFRSLRRIVDFVVHVVVFEVEVFERDVGGSDFLGASLHFRPDEARLVAFRSVRGSTDGGVDDVDGLFRGFRVRPEHFGQLVRLRLCSRFQKAEIFSGHILAGHDDDYFCIWQNSRVIVNMIGNVPYLRAGNDVETDVRSVGGMTEERR